MDGEDNRLVSGKRPYKKRVLKLSYSEPKLKRVKGSSGLTGKTRSDGSVIVKGNWTDAEDERLIELVHQSLEDKKNYKVAIASTRWSEIAKELPGRVGKQCRERWHNHLRPDINKGRWSFCEEVVIYLCWRVWNSQWARISRLLDGRSDNRVKNHWNCHMKRRLTRDKPYFNFMEEAHAHFYQTIADAEDDDFEDGQFRDMLIPMIENFLSERQNRIDRLPYFSVSKKENERSQCFTEDFNSVAAAASMVSKPPRPSKKSSKREAGKPSKRGRKPKDHNATDPGPSRTYAATAWTMKLTPDSSFQDEGEENVSIITSPTGGHFSIYSHLTAPQQHYPRYHHQAHSEVDEKPDMDILLNGSGCGTMFGELNGFRSPIPGYASEVVVEDGGVSQQAMSGDPLWSRAVRADFSMGSPMYFGKHGMTVTSTPLKTPSYNVPLASECGASVFSPFHGMRQMNSGTPFMGYLADETNFLSPIKRSSTDTSGHNESAEWSPSKLTLAWSPVKLGSVVIKTPQPIREALARSDLNRSNISPEDLNSPGRLFSDASELIDGELNGSAVKHALDVSGCSSVRVVTETPELLQKCRRRLADQWASVSFNSSGYASFQAVPSTSSGIKMETDGSF
ncbi:hypothetical protein RvY_11398 [Ramazzottius varieornatus]|uniref:Myb-like domain-containing protein n=1 Tax=Ramazzottius varieornatus TaxID=947166 RepID=A0A1D1VI23_RAMVA|nr:hypothetical protein RvY_11398 [Ramazzottius varieornatus]